MTELMGTWFLCQQHAAQIIPMNNFEIQAQARIILDAIAFTPFEQCQPLSRNFRNIPARPGIYAIRHKTDGLL